MSKRGWEKSLINLKFQSPHSRILSSSLFSLLPSFNFPSHFLAPTNGVAIRIMDNEMGYLPLPGDKATESHLLKLHFPACLSQREVHYVCHGPCGSKRGEGDEEEKREEELENTNMEMEPWIPDRQKILLD